VIISDGESSIVGIDPDLGVAVKAYKRTYQHLYDFERELYWLETLKDCHWFPQLKAFSTHDRELTLEYAGVEVTQDCLPNDWRDQAETILQCLEIYRCAHNDIRPPNLLVKGGKLTLIDLQWATPLGVTPPKDWPERIGSVYRAYGLGSWIFCDRTSLYRSLEDIERGIV
jgi:hypothetical protein